MEIQLSTFASEDQAVWVFIPAWQMAGRSEKLLLLQMVSLLYSLPRDPWTALDTEGI